MKAKRERRESGWDFRFDYVSIKEAEKLEAEIKELERNLFGILAIIHRDGGHHTRRFGRNTSVSDAIQAWTARQTEIEELKDCPKKQEVYSKWMEEYISYLKEQHTQRSAVSKEKIRQLEAKVKGTAEGYRELKSDLQLEQCRTTGAFRCVDNLKQENKKLRIANVLFIKDADELQKKNDKLQKYADELAAGLPDGMLPKDVELLRADNAYLAHGAIEVKEELDVVRGIELRTRNERDYIKGENARINMEVKMLKSNLDAARGFSGATEAKKLREENTQLRGKDKELKDAGVRFRQIMDSQANVIARCWEDIRQLKEKKCILNLALINIRYVLKKDFLPSATAERIIERINYSLKD